MKRILSLLTVITLVFTLTSCENDAANADDLLYQAECIDCSEIEDGDSECIDCSEIEDGDSECVDCSEIEDDDN